MRRFTSVFAPKHVENPDAISTQPPQQLNPTKKFSKRPTHPLNIITPPTLLSPRSHPSHSSGSSSGSASLRTPDEDPIATRMKHKKSWISWLAPKKSATPNIQKSRWDDPNTLQDWSNISPIQAGGDPPPTQSPTSINPLVDVTDDDSSEVSDDYDDSLSLSATGPAVKLPASPSFEKSRNNFQLLVSISIGPSIVSSPFCHVPRTPLFPRSSNSAYAFPPQESLRSQMHKTRLLRRIELGNLSPSEDRSLTPFATRPTPPVEIRRKLPPIDEEYVDGSHVTSTSQGLRKWLSRPCFEDRFAVWLPAQEAGGFKSQIVTGSGFAVAELEYSESVEAMAGMDVEQSDKHEKSAPPVLEVPAPHKEPPSMPSTSSGELLLTTPTSLLTFWHPVPINTRHAPYKAQPSPLRIQHDTHSLQVSPASSPNIPSQLAPSNPDPPPATTVKRGVRFVDDGKEDQVPLAYVMRIKKSREEKARFLREEQERRAWEEERRKRDLERLEREKERREWEKEKKAWEKEKKAIEDERKARLYAEEVAAARLRRESVRAGGNGALLSSSSSLVGREPDNRSQRETKRYSRPVYDSMQNSRRQASEASVPQLHNESRANTRPPSVGGGSVRQSRPPSVYSVHTLSSAEDIRQREGSSGGKRTSMSLHPPQRPVSDRSSTYPIGYNTIPPVPPVPQFAMDVPLLPPTPPFMMQQYPRSRSSHASLPSSSKQRLPRADSSEQVAHGSQQQQQRNRSHTGHSSQPKEPLPRRSSYSPASSDGGHTHRPSTYPHSHSQPNSLSRARQPISSYLQPPSPWTALPSIAQFKVGPTSALLPSARSQPGSRQTTIS
jgi:hypothetical protein